MQKTISLSINTALFHVEEDAYKQLSEYLAAVKKHFKNYEDSEEITTDIESRIAEHLQEKITTTKHVITRHDVEELIARLGTVADFDTDASAKSDYEPDSVPHTTTIKKLYRNPDDEIVGGVASGIAAYVGIDSVLVRMAFVLFTLFGGSGILVYLILLFIMPEAKTPTEKMQMQGEPLSLESIDKKVRDLEASAEQLPNTRIGHIAKKSLSLTRAIGERSIQWIPAMGRKIGALTGLLLVLVAFSTTFALLSTLVLSVVYPQLYPFDSSLMELLGDWRFLSTAFHMTLIIPVVALGLAGASFLAKKNLLQWRVSIVLVLFWLISLVSLGVSTFAHLPGLTKWWQEQNFGFEERIEREISVSEFERLEANSNVKVELVIGPVTRVVARGNERVLDQLSVEVRDTTLVIEQKHEWVGCLICWVQPVTLYVTTPQITQVQLSGSSQISATHLEESALAVVLSGSSRADFYGRIEDVGLQLSGSSQVSLSGSGSTMSGKLSGESKLSAKGFPVQTSTLELSGGSTAEIDATERLTAQISGGSQLRYYFYPELVIDTKATGGGSATPLQKMQMRDSGDSTKEATAGGELDVQF